VAYLQVAGCRLNWPLAIKSTSLYIARRSDKSALRDFPQVPTELQSPAPEPGPNHFPSGLILQGRRINRSVPRRPAIPRSQPRTPQDTRAESTLVSQRSQHPGVSPVARQASTLTAADLQGSNGPARFGCLEVGP